jgi:methyl-accepting chemotaxis protein
MVSFSSMKISVKIMMVLALLGAVTIGVAVYAAQTLQSSNRTYAKLVGVQLPGSIRLARVNRQAVEMVYAGYRAMVYDANTAEARTALTSETDRYGQASAALADVIKAEPAAAAALNDIKAKLDTLHDLTGDAVKLGAVDRNDEARLLLAKADAQMDALSAALRAFNDARLAQSDKDSSMLTAQGAATVTTILTASIVGLIGAFAIALFVSASQITRPIARLQETMRTLAGGRTDVEVPGTDRGDEIGVMAASVLVFRDAAVRQQQEAVAKQAAEAEQKLVVESLEHGLGQLAAGDLTADIAEEYPAAYASCAPISTRRWSRCAN